MNVCYAGYVYKSLVSFSSISQGSTFIHLPTLFLPIHYKFTKKSIVSLSNKSSIHAYFTTSQIFQFYTYISMP